MAALALDRIARAAHGRLGESCLFRCPGWAAEATASAIVERRASPIGDSLSYEDGPTATVLRADLPGDLAPGATMESASGELFFIESYPLNNGVYSIALRPDVVL